MNIQNDRKEGVTLSAKTVMEIASKRLTERDMLLLEILRKHRFASRDHLLELVGMKNLKQGKVILNKRLKFLYDNHFVDRAVAYMGPNCSKPTLIYSLDRAYRFMAGKKSWKKCIKHIKMADGTISKRLPITYMHNLVINDMVCIMKRTAEDTGWDMVHVGIEEENFMPIAYKKKSGIVPDVVAIFADIKFGNIFSLFLEVDLGNEGKELIKSKIKHYYMLKTYRTWVDASWYKQHVASHSPSAIVFPHLTFLVGNSNSARHKMIKDALDEWNLNSSVMSLPNFESWLRSQML